MTYMVYKLLGKYCSGYTSSAKYAHILLPDLGFIIFALLKNMINERELGKMAEYEDPKLTLSHVYS